MMKVNLQLTAIDAVKKACKKDYDIRLFVSKEGEVLIYSWKNEFGVVIGNHLHPLISRYDDNLQNIVSQFFYKGEKIAKTISRNFCKDEWEWAINQALRPSIKRMGLTKQDVEDALVTFKWLQNHC